MIKGNPSVQFDYDLLNGTGSFPTFVPGQTVSGKVMYSAQSQKTIDEVVIILKGKCFTWIKRRNGGNSGSSIYKEKIELFRFHECLFRGPYTMQATNFEWPFSFVLPETTSYLRETGSDNPFYNGNPQPLPPSMNIEEEGLTHCRAVVSYELKVKVNPGRLLHSEKITQPLIVIPYSRTLLPQPIPVGVTFPHQEWKSKQLRAEQHSFKQKMSHVFGNDPSLQTPKIVFGATAYIPNAASIWQPMPVSLSIQHRSTVQCDPENPVLVLDSIHVEIKAHTNLRVKGTFGSHDAIAKGYLGGRTIRGSNAILPLNDQPIQLTNSFRLVDLCRDWRLAPSFKTYTINQSYGVKLTVSIQHQETGHVFQFETKAPFEIFPIEDPNRAMQPPIAQKAEASDTSAPTYELATASSPAYYPDHPYQEPHYLGPSYQESPHTGLSYQEPLYTGPSYQDMSYQSFPPDEKRNKQSLY